MLRFRRELMSGSEDSVCETRERRHVRAQRRVREQRHVRDQQHAREQSRACVLPPTSVLVVRLRRLERVRLASRPQLRAAWEAAAECASGVAVVADHRHFESCARSGRAKYPQSKHAGFWVACVEIARKFINACAEGRKAGHAYKGVRRLLH